MKLRIHGLMYHDVVTTDRGTSGLPGAGPDRYKLTWNRFIEHLDRIGEAVRVAPIVVDGDLHSGSGRSWSLTFDDGGVSALPVGEELARRGWHGYFFVTTGLIGTDGFVDEAAIRTLDEMGHVVGSHSVTHPERMSSLGEPELESEWEESVATLASILGKPVRTGSIPGGYYARRVAVVAARAGISTLFTSEPVRTARPVDNALVVGRYSVRADTSADVAARVAAGDDGPWLRQYLGWNLRKPAKALAGGRYDDIRRAVLGRSSSSARD